MLGDGEEDTPSRHELLSMVKKHSNMLVKIDDDEKDPSDVEMDLNFWKGILDVYFIRGRESRGRQEDDLIFFVRKMNLHGYGFNDHMEGEPPYFVRRWASKMETVVGPNSADVDWRRSFYLNLIAHTSYTVTVAICSIQDLRGHQNDAETKLSPIYKVVKTVYASASRVNIHLDSKKEVETSSAYPDICFAIDDFDSTFGAVVLTEMDHCYCVLLNAHDGAAFPADKAVDSGTGSDKSPLSSDIGSGRGVIPKRTLFSGFVSYHMVREAYYAGKSGFGSLLSIGQSPGKTDRIYMRGPGGRGEVEVAVSDIADQTHQVNDPSSPLRMSKGSFGDNVGTLFRKAASAASIAAKQAYAAATSSSRFDDEHLPLKCNLMSISLPWEYLAHDLLFKEAPPVAM
ncbi:hypothetical protein C5167_037386 [Papaver somniferum]|uniref:Cw7 protein n=1 Tax=Papaver somniferum TaxID=3469 RepID=A0A4Y7IAJ8_PAPSO|nr:uncharacterized protein KIAA0930 homolog [Papaver somniferum]RZC44429.1 hypothetical protein C5167_037386 [Papaver somniferum]